MMKGVIIKSTGSWYEVKTDNTIYTARIKGKFRNDTLKLTNPIAVGDFVDISLDLEHNDVMITKIYPRDNYIIRQSPRKKHFHHMIAANVDQVFLVTTLKYPDIKIGFIDRYLLMTAPFDIPTHIIINKSDLYDEEQLKLFQNLQLVYEPLGYHLHLVSSLYDKDLDQLRIILKDKVTLVGGHSGVGKSTLLNAIDKKLQLRTNELSDYSGKGQHTTTFAEMYALDNGGSIIDTPGIKPLAFINMEPLDVAHNFKEMFMLSSKCKYNNCLHQNEPGCAVKEGVANGEVHELRYMNYLQILEDVQDQNYWERNKEM